MKFIYATVFLLFISCGPTDKERQEIEKEIISIKEQMITLMNESSDLVINIDKYNIQKSNIEIGENMLNEISQELKGVSPGSKEEKDLKIKEKNIVSRLEIEKEKFKNQGDIDLMEKELQSYGEKYDSLEKLLNEKTYLIKE